MRTLVAGFGNELRADDGFGVVVIHRLVEALSPRSDVELLEVGTGGLALAQALLDPYDRLIVIDAMTRGGRPGQLYVLRLDSVERIREVDLHLATPERALSVAQALGGLPAEVYLVGCEPGEVDELTTELTPPVRAAIDNGVSAVLSLLPPIDVGATTEAIDV